MDYYATNAKSIAQQYSSLEPERVHSSWLQYLPAEPGLACDIGAGAGRDALWLADHGWDVTAVEPCEALKQALPSKHDNITWLSDTLPNLQQLQSQHHCYSLILISAVWMHLTQTEQSTALQRVKGLLAPNGLLIITWRNQADDTGRQFKKVDESIFQGAEIICSEDMCGRKGVEWKTAVIKGGSP